MRVAIGVLALFASGCRDKPGGGEPPSNVGETAQGEDAGPAGPAAPQPHPDYPTAASAGTDKIFTLEEPDRGEQVPLTFDLKAHTARMTWSTHVYCESYATEVICSARSTPANWRVGRRSDASGRAVVAMPASPREETFLYLAKPDGKPIRRYDIDAYGRVAAMMTFVGSRITHRRLDGSNALAGCGGLSYALDAKGHVSKVGCLQWSGEPMLDTNGVAGTRYERDDRGFITAVRHDGLSGTPVLNVDGIASKHYELDADGREARVRYRDTAGKPVASIRGCHGYRWEYDATNALTQETCLDADDRIVQDSSHVAIRVTRTDRRGCAISTRFQMFNNAPAPNDDGVLGFDLKVDAFCAETSRTCLGIDNVTWPCGVGRPAKIVTQRDRFGNATVVRNYDDEGQPGADYFYGVFELRHRFDERGRKISLACHGPHGGLTECVDMDFHRKSLAYDDAGRNTEQRFFDTGGKPTHNLGTWLSRYTYDNYDHRYEDRSYDETGELMASGGAAIRRDLYDASHRVFAIVMLDKEGKAADYSDCYAGATCPTGSWHAARVVRRVDGKVEKNQFFDRRGQLVDTTDCNIVACFD